MFCDCVHSSQSAKGEAVVPITTAEVVVPAPPFLYLALFKLLTSDQVVPSYCSVFASALPGGAGAPPHIIAAVFTSAPAP